MAPVNDAGVDRGTAVTSRLRRARGALLRLAYHRLAAALSGGVLLLPAVLLMRGEYRWESWVSDGLALVCGATGAALLLAAAGGRRPDWIDPE